MKIANDAEILLNIYGEITRNLLIKIFYPMRKIISIKGFGKCIFQSLSYEEVTKLSRHQMSLLMYAY